MLKQLELKYSKLQDQNLSLMIKHLNKPKGTPYSKEILTNHVLLTKIGQLIRKIKGC